MKKIILCAALSAVVSLPTLNATQIAAKPDASSVATPAETEDESARLAKELSNPIASLISLPFQANEDFRIGTAHGNKFTLNIQPVIPIALNKDWNLIIRTILPIISQNDVFGHSGSQTGLGDTTQSFFLSPQAPGPGGIVWGVGPVGYYPTATNDLLGSGKWGMGPTAVLLKQEGGWTIGALANQIWSVGGTNDRQNISAMFLQPFIAYTTRTHTTFTFNTESTYDWENTQWTIPLNLMVSQILKIGKLPVSIQLGGRYYADGPDGHAHWGMRLNFTLLFPTAHEAPEPAPSKK